MADIFQMLVDILKITPQQVSEYASQGPLYQMFYLFIFPTIFVVVFIYILSYRIMRFHHGLRVLLAAAVYAFIILQGYYNWFVMLSKFWFFGLIFLGFIFLMLGRGGGGEGGGGKRLAIPKSIFNSAKTALIGDRTFNPLEIAADSKLYDQKIRELQTALKEAESEKSRTPKEQQGIVSDSIARLRGEIKELEHRRTEHLRLRKAAA
jgi:hypothetical protein